MNAQDCDRRARFAYYLSTLARGLALFFGGFGLVNVFGDFWHRGFDANVWWLDLRRLAPVFSNSIILGASLALVVFGFRPPKSRAGQWIVRISAGGLALI